MDYQRDARSWRRLALAACAVTGLLVARVRAGRPLAANWLGETRDAELERRLGACEAHLVDLEERLYGNAQHG